MSRFLIPWISSRGIEASGLAAEDYCHAQHCNPTKGRHNGGLAHG